MNWMHKKLIEAAIRLGVANPIPCYFRDDPPAYWVLMGDNIDVVDLGMNFKQALESLQRGEAMHGGKIELI